MVASTIDLPNIRRMIVPDPGYGIADADLSGADAQVVAWDAGDEDLKAAFKSGIKIHAHNAKGMYGHVAGIDGKNEPYYGNCKRRCHAYNYCGSPRTVSRTLGTTEAEERGFQRKWFNLHPAIPRWHARLDIRLAKSRTVYNAFGYRRVFFDRIEQCLPNACAWIGQSTVAIVCQRGQLALYEATKNGHLPWVRMLIQVHDSIIFQYKLDHEDELWKVRDVITNPVPYEDELIIPWGLKTSHVSWGDVEDRSWT